MEFRFDTDYNLKALIAMAKALRKTVRKKKSILSHIFGFFVVALGLLLSLISGFEFSPSNIVTWIAMLIIIVVLLFEDRINGYTAKKQMMPGAENAKSTFNEQGFSSQTAVSSTEWKYEKIQVIAEDNNYFIFLLSNIHAQVYSKESISGGTSDEFREFIEKATGKKVIRIK